ncbi:MAG TPA: hypothetical protein VFV57_07285 [Limnobacter sp.]|nr:hypothetical protein [Limnobacter sp.]
MEKFKQLGSWALVVGVLFAALNVGGCGTLNSVSESVGQGIAARMLAKHVGQPYQPIHDQKPYGPFIGEEKLANGMVVKKHFTSRMDEGLLIDDMKEGIGFDSKKRMATYFLVDKKGVVQDWAFGYVTVGTGFSLGAFNLTEMFGSKDRDVFIDEVDGVVRTKDDQPYTVWRAAKG